MEAKLKTISTLMKLLRLVLSIGILHDGYLVCLFNIQTLYEFVFCFGEINQEFSISTVMPCQVIPCSGATTLTQCGISQPSTLAIYLKDDGDILDLLSTEQVCACM